MHARWLALSIVLILIVAAGGFYALRTGGDQECARAAYAGA
jgi:hypothetical protein